MRSVGHGLQPVQGNVLELVMDAQTGELTDWGIMRDSATDNSLAKLGAVKVG